MKKLLLSALFLLMVGSLAAQPYKWAAGIRIGSGMSGLSVKHFFDAGHAIDGSVTIPYKSGFNALALFEWQVPVINDHFRFYYGAGMNLGSWNDDHHTEFTIGVDAVVGLEYKMRQAPFAFSIDYVPTINFTGPTGFYWNGFSLGIKYTF